MGGQAMLTALSVQKGTVAWTQPVRSAKSKTTLTATSAWAAELQAAHAASQRLRTFPAHQLAPKTTGDTLPAVINE